MNGLLLCLGLLNLSNLLGLGDGQLVRWEVRRLVDRLSGFRLRFGLLLVLLLRLLDRDRLRLPRGLRGSVLLVLRSTPWRSRVSSNGRVKVALLLHVSADDRRVDRLGLLSVRQRS